MSVSPEEPRPTELREQIADAIDAAFDSCPDGVYVPSYAADAVLAVSVVSRALQIAARLDALDPYDMPRKPYEVCSSCAKLIIARLRAVGVVDPKPASSDDRNRASRASVGPQPEATK